MADSIDKLNGWKKDTIPNSKYNFLLNGKPYKGAFNRRYVGKIITYYTSRARSRYSLQLEYIAKGFTVEDQPITTMMERWLFKEPLNPVRFVEKPIVSEVPIYGNSVGQYGIENEAVRNAIVGYNMVSKNPFNGKTKILATSFDSRMNELEKQRNDLLRSTARDQGAMLTNRALKPPRDKEALRQSLKNSIGKYYLEDIKDIYPKVPEAPPVDAPPFVIKRNSMLSGKKADDYLNKNFNEIKKYIDTLPDRNMSVIVDKVTDKFKVNKTRAIKCISNTPEVYNRNK